MADFELRLEPVVQVEALRKTAVQGAVVRSFRDLVAQNLFG
jgi:hypothetical protein